MLQPCGFCRKEHSVVSLRGHLPNCRQRHFLQLLENGEPLLLVPGPDGIEFRIVSVTRETIMARSVLRVESGIENEIGIPATCFRGIDPAQNGYRSKAFLDGNLKWSNGLIFASSDGMRVVQGRSVPKGNARRDSEG